MDNRKVVISWCPQSKVRRRWRCVRSVATTTVFSGTDAGKDGVVVWVLGRPTCLLSVIQPSFWWGGVSS